MYQESLRIVNTSSSNINSSELRDKYFQQRREYKQFLRNKRKLFLNAEKEKLWSLRSDSPKTFWKTLNKGKKRAELKFTNDQLYNYFNSLLQNTAIGSENNQEIDNRQTHIDMLMQNQINENLNSLITIEEVKNMVKSLKNSKAPGLDMITSELLKHLNDRFYTVFVHLFNRILESGDFPEEWAIGIIYCAFIQRR